MCLELSDFISKFHDVRRTMSILDSQNTKTDLTAFYIKTCKLRLVSLARGRSDLPEGQNEVFQGLISPRNRSIIFDLDLESHLVLFLRQ